MNPESAPHDLESESNAIASALVYEGRSGIGAMAAIIQPEDFFDATNANAWMVILDLWSAGKDINQITVAAELAQRDQLQEFGGQTRLSDIIRNNPVASSGPWYAEQIRDKAIARRVQQAGHRIAVRAAQGGEPEELVDFAQQLVSALGVNRTKALTRSMAEIAEGAVNGDGAVSQIGNFLADPTEIRGLTFGWPQLEASLNGLQPTQLYTVMADTSVGKSIFAHYMAWQVAMTGAPVLIVSTEMSGDEIYERLVFMVAGIDKEQIRANGTANEGQKTRIINAEDRVAKLPIFVTDVGGISLQTLQAEVRRRVQGNGVRLLICDHMQHVRVQAARGPVERMEAVMLGMKEIAMNLDIPVVAVSHINRDSAKNGITVHSGKGASAIEQDSNCVITLEPMTFEDGQWQVMGEEQADARRAQANALCIRAKVSKNRGGSKRWALRMLDWNAGGRFVEMPQ